MFCNLMSIPAPLIMDYFELLTGVPDGELADIRQSIEKRTANPMEHKMRLAREIVSQFHSWDVAEEANAGFERTFRKRELPVEAGRGGAVLGWGSLLRGGRPRSLRVVALPAGRRGADKHPPSS